jgi:hypothetical protein
MVAVGTLDHLGVRQHARDFLAKTAYQLYELGMALLPGALDVAHRLINSSAIAKSLRRSPKLSLRAAR